MNNEAQLAKVVVDYLTLDGWEVFQEVKAKTGNTCDIVARRDKILWAIECKTNLTMKVLAQAIGWHWQAHYVSVAIGKWSKESIMIYDCVAGKYGIGCIKVCPSTIIHHTQPSFHRRSGVGLSGALCEEQKDYCPAGTSHGSAWTPYQQTCNALREYVRQNPGCNVTQAMRDIKHHYHSHSTARSSMLIWLKGGKIKGIRVERQGCSYLLYITDKENENG